MKCARLLLERGANPNWIDDKLMKHVVRRSEDFTLSIENNVPNELAEVLLLGSLNVSNQSRSDHKKIRQAVDCQLTASHNCN